MAGILIAGGAAGVMVGATGVAVGAAGVTVGVIACGRVAVGFTSG